MAIRLTTYEHSQDIPDFAGTNVFHSVEIFKALEQDKGLHPSMLVATEDGKPAGRLLCVVRPWLSWIGLDALSVYGTGDYYPCGHSREQVFSEMLAYVTQSFRDKAFLLEFRNLEEPLFGYRYFRLNGYFCHQWTRVQNTLKREELEKWMSPGRKRQITLGLARGAKLEVADTEEKIMEFFAMVKHYYLGKSRRYMPQAAFFLELHRLAAGRELSRTFIVRYKGKVIGGSVALFSGSKAYLMFSCGLRRTFYRMLTPGVLAVWSAIEYAMERGYETFEFIDAGLPFRKHGYRDFILRFGGKQLGSRRWFKIRWSWLNRLLQWLYL